MVLARIGDRVVGRIALATSLALMGWMVLAGVSEGDARAGEASAPVVPMSRLKERIDEYYALFRDGHYKKVWGMWPEAYREDTEETKRDELKDWREMGRGLRFLGWDVTRVRLSDKIAKVDITVHAKMKTGWFKWEPVEDTEEDYWLFEKGDWYYMPLKLSDWNDSVAMEVPLSVLVQSGASSRDPVKTPR